MTDRAATSPELTGGAGFTFEAKCSALYLVALMAETVAPGLKSETVAVVELQRGSFGAPMDDIIVTGRGVDGSSRTLSLQVKRELRVSAAASNSAFRDIVAKGLATIRGTCFSVDHDRIGAITGTIAAKGKRALEAVCEWARSSLDVGSFQAHFASGVANDDHRGVRSAVRAALLAAEPNAADTDLWVFLRHFILVTVDLLHEGSTQEAQVVALLSRCLAPVDSTRAFELWQSLNGIAREEAGLAAQFDRTSLLGRLYGRFRFAAAPSFHDDLKRLSEEAFAALADISDEVDQIHLPRPAAVAEIINALSEHRFVQVSGLPGVGKSAVIREVVTSYAALGPVLFLKADRIHGRSWLAHAATLGLKGQSLKSTLVEIASCGTAIAFIDGLDRVEVASRAVVNDILNLLANDEELVNWRVLATVRDNGLEPLRTWLSGKWLHAGVASVEVKPFSDEEAKVIADARPRLKDLLFGTNRIRELTRRPFFLAVLARLPFTLGIATEIDLADAWWKRGGYDALPDRLGHRQQALIQLAQEGARTTGRGVSIRTCDPTAIAELRNDGVIKDVRSGHTVGFTHDIYFEWAFLHLSINREREWTNELRNAGEPPVLGRVVELLSQIEYRYKESWEIDLRALETSDLRPQWTRAWLMGPFVSPNFDDDWDQMSNVAFGNGGARLKRLTVWFQAEKTKPNQIILRQATSHDVKTTLKVADSLAWPSELPAWKRLISWLLADPAKLPHHAINDIVSVCEVWQNMLARITNRWSEIILTATSNWLGDLEERLYSDSFERNFGPWEAQSDRLKELDRRLRAIVLHSGWAYPDRVRSYVELLRSRERLRKEAFDQVLEYSPVLADVAPELLADYTLDETLDELPEVVALRPIEVDRFWIPRVNHHDWHTLAIKREGRAFDTVSPIAQPFASLFACAPIEARRLVRRLANHAITAWRQLHALQIDRSARPIPLTLQLPWGSQTFWGDQQVYQWYRAVLCPKAVACGLMALEAWALNEIDAGRHVDDVLKDILEGHECCSVLGVAVSVILKLQRPTLAGAVLVTSARLWSWDLRRVLHDRSFPPNLISSPFSERAAMEAVRQGNQLPFRKWTLRDVAPIYVLAPDDDLRTNVQRRIQRFPEHPAIDFEEERENEYRLAEANRTAEIWAKIGDPETYSVEVAPEGEGILIRHESPHAGDEDVVQMRRNNEELNKVAGLVNWARTSFEEGRLALTIALADAILVAQSLDAADLFTDVHPDDFPKNLTRSAVAGVAASGLCFGTLSEGNNRWARDAVTRSARTHEPSNTMFVAEAIVPDHPCIFAAKGLRALIVSGKDRREDREHLLALAIHPLEEVSAAALGEAMACWDADSRLAWAALDLGLRMSVGRWGERSSPYGYDHTSNRKVGNAAWGTAVKKLRARRSDETLATLPAAWVKDAGGKRGLRPQPPKDSGWRAPDEFLRWDFLPKVMRRTPIQKILADPLRRPAFLDLCDHLLSWTLQQLSPPWQDRHVRGRWQSESTELYEWRRELFTFFAIVALELDPEEVRLRYLQPVFELEDAVAMSMIEPFVRRLAAAGVHDPINIRPSAMPLLEICMNRVLAASEWQRTNWRDGRLHSHDLSNLVRDMLFVSIEHAGGASRFSNGDWREILVVVPLVERLVAAVGDVPDVASAFFTLCERSLECFPARTFADLCQAMIERGEGAPVGWRGQLLPARMASLIQLFAEMNQPLDSKLAQDFLRLLDALVEMGDRRSAALQISEVFKDVRVTPSSDSGRG